MCKKRTLQIHVYYSTVGKYVINQKHSFLSKNCRIAKMLVDQKILLLIFFTLKSTSKKPEDLKKW